MPNSRAALMCCAETSASVAGVATRTDLTPSECTSFRSSIVPIPGSDSVVSCAFVTTEAGASIHSGSVCAPAP